MRVLVFKATWQVEAESLPPELVCRGPIPNGRDERFDACLAAAREAGSREEVRRLMRDWTDEEDMP